MVPIKKTYGLRARRIVRTNKNHIRDFSKLPPIFPHTFGTRIIHKEAPEPACHVDSLSQDIINNGISEQTRLIQNPSKSSLRTYQTNNNQFILELDGEVHVEDSDRANVIDETETTTSASLKTILEIKSREPLVPNNMKKRKKRKKRSTLNKNSTVPEDELGLLLHFSRNKHRKVNVSKANLNSV